MVLSRHRESRFEGLRLMPADIVAAPAITAATHCWKPAFRALAPSLFARPSDRALLMPF